MNDEYFSQCTNPGAAFRRKPFWAWNGRLEADELRRQVRVFQQMGLGGFFMHARVGLQTPYLEEEWFELVEACIDEAGRLGMEAWLYDEDRWPSGQAGGLVTRDPAWVGRCLQLGTPADAGGLAWSDDVIAAFTARLDGATASEVCQVPRGEAPGVPAGHDLLVLRRALLATSAFYNGGGPLDRMNPQAVRRFLDVTHEAYAARVGEHFGRAVPGIFTDEPHFGRFARDSVPWTDRLPEVFRRRYGYDIVRRLVELFFDVPDKPGHPGEQARYHFHDCVTHLFVDSFSRQIGQWCAEHGLQLTGHVVEEDTLRVQAQTVGSAMRFYEHMQLPGIDLLMENKHGYNTAKQCTSVARQLGRPWRISELYGCTGWHLNFESHKAIGDWQAALGINVRCHHLSYYTMLGEAKRDFPASISCQSPWWKHYEKVEGYFSRVHAAMSRGREVRDLLVIHPVESLWLVRNREAEKDPRVAELEAMFFRLVSTLLTGHVDFDYGDEELLSRHGAVAESGSPAGLTVGQAEYKAVLVPPVVTVRSSTLALLREFADGGGLVVFAGAPPRFVDGVASDSPAELARRCTRVPGLGPETIDALAPTCRPVSIADPAGREIAEALYLLKEDDDAFYLFVINTSRVAKGWDNEPLARERRASFADVRVRGFAGCGGEPIEIDADSGEAFFADATRAGDGEWEIRTSLPRIGSRLFVVPRSAAAAPACVRRRARLAEVSAAELDPPRWDVSLSEPNVLVLDRPAWRVGEGAWKPSEEILRVDRAVRESMGLAYRGGFMMQPWAQKRWEPPAGPARRTRVELRYAFDVRSIPQGPLMLGIECPEVFEIRLNGQPVANGPANGWWTDKSLTTLPLDCSLLRAGANELSLGLTYDEGFSGLEILYLLGDFGVVVEGTNVAIAGPVRTLAVGDWCGQGLPFYSGCVTYRAPLGPPPADGERLIMRSPEYGGAAVRVLVNGREAGIAAWEPNEVDLTALARSAGPGATLELEVLGHRRNSHGPLHYPVLYPGMTGPMHFVTRDGGWTDGYQLVPMGLLRPPQRIIRREAQRQP